MNRLVQGSAPETAFVVDTFNNSSEQRDALRKQLRDKRRALNETALQTAADALTPHVLATLDTLGPLRKVAGYLAFQGEIDVAAILDELRRQSVTTFVPMLQGETLAFAEWSDSTPSTVNRFGIVEPEVPEPDWINADTLDAVLVPLVGFDAKGQRMGMGGGFYDKTFANRKNGQAPPWLIGVAHSIQQVETVYADWWDVPLDAIVTDKGLAVNRLS